MRTIIRCALALVCLCISVSAQSDVFKYSRSATLAGAATAFTISLPATAGSQVTLLDFVIQCSADCVVSTENNGTAPTGTAAAWRAEDPDTAPAGQPKALIWRDSDSTGGTISDEPFIFPANALVPWDIGGITLTGTGGTNNWTVRIGPMTGTYRFQIRVRVRR